MNDHWYLSRKRSSVAECANAEFDHLPKRSISSDVWWTRCRSTSNAGEYRLLPDMHTMHLISLLRREMSEDPLRFTARVFQVLSEADSDAMLKLYCLSSFKTLLPKLEQNRAPAISIILEAMGVYCESSDVQMEACKLLSILIQSPSEEIEDPQFCLEVLLTTLERFLADPALVVFGLDLVRRLKSVLAIEEWADAVEIVSGCCRQHSSIVAIQQIGLSLLAWLAENDNCRNRVLESNGLVWIPDCMQRHADDALIICNAAAALCWLVHASSRVVDFGHEHVSTIVGALERHIANASVFGNCVCVLCGIPSLEYEGTILSHVQQGLRLHRSSAKVQESCLRWIRFCDPDRCTEQLAAMVPELLDGMRAHPRDAHLQAQACELLTFYADHELLARALTEHGAADVVLEVLKEHRNETRVQQGALWFLTLLLPRSQATTGFGGSFAVVEGIWQSLGLGQESDTD